MNKIAKDSETLASILRTTRYNSKISQDQMAMELGVSKNTIYNWEKGTSQPSIKQFKSWLETLGLNPTPYVLQYCNSDQLSSITTNPSDKTITAALNTAIESLSIEDKQQLLFLLTGEHGSDPGAIIQLASANLHTSLDKRFGVANLIKANYSITPPDNNLDKSKFGEPDLDKINQAISDCQNMLTNNK